MDSDRVHMLFWRVIPGFGVDCDKLKELLLTNCSSSTSNVGGGEETDICPAAFFDLAMECVKEEPKHRPLLRDILKRLRAIEGDIIRSETEASAVNVGVFGKIVFLFKEWNL